MQKTQNYQLNQYEPQDNFLRTDFNADNQKIDAALKKVEDKADSAATRTELTQLSQRVDGKADQTALTQGLAQKCEAYLGSYTGDSDSPTVAWRTISLGFTPKAVLVVMGGGQNGHTLDDCAAQLALQGSKTVDLEIVEGGFKVYSKLNETDSRYNPYNYIALR